MDCFVSILVESYLVTKNPVDSLYWNKILNCGTHSITYARYLIKMNYLPPKVCYKIETPVTPEMVECLKLYLLEHRCIEAVVTTFFDYFFANDHDGNFVDDIEIIIAETNIYMLPDILESMYQYIKCYGSLNYYKLYENLRRNNGINYPDIRDRIAVLIHWPDIHQYLVNNNRLEDYMDNFSPIVVQTIFKEIVASNQNDELKIKSFENFVTNSHPNIISYLHGRPVWDLFDFRYREFCDVAHGILKKHGFGASIDKVGLFKKMLEFGQFGFSPSFVGYSNVDKSRICNWLDYELQSSIYIKFLSDLLVWCDKTFEFFVCTNKRKRDVYNSNYMTTSQLHEIADYCFQENRYDMLNLIFTFLPLNTQKIILNAENFYDFITWDVYKHCRDDILLGRYVLLKFLHKSKDQLLLTAADELNVINPFAALKLDKYPVVKMVELMKIKCKRTEIFNVGVFVRLLKWIDECNVSHRLVESYVKYINSNATIETTNINIFMLFDCFGVRVDKSIIKYFVRYNLITVDNFHMADINVLTSMSNFNFIYIWKHFIIDNAIIRRKFWWIVYRLVKKRLFYLKSFFVRVKNKTIILNNSEQRILYCLGKWTWRYIEQYLIDVVESLDSHVIFLLQRCEYKRIKMLYKRHPRMVRI